MYFLKCNNCGYLNEVRSESLSFCYKCNKPLNNSFSEWKKNNIVGTFEEFKQQVCTSNEGLVKEKPRRSSSVRTKVVAISSLTVIAGALAFSVFYLVGQYGGKSLLDWFRTEKTASDVMDKKWITDSYGSFGLTLSTPEKMIKNEVPIPDNVKKMIDEMDSYDYSSQKGFKVAANSIKYDSIVNGVNLQGAANGAANEMKNSPGTTDFRYTEEHVLKNSIPGIIQHGNFKADGVDAQFTNVMYNEGFNMWQVIIICQDNDDVGIAASKRVMESIHIKNKL